MLVDDRVSIKTINERIQSIGYEAVDCRFGASDGVALLGIHGIVENPTADSFIGTALSRNPGHLEAPPANIEAFFLDEALYGRMFWGTELSASEGSWTMGTRIIPMYEIVVPSRQIAVFCVINASRLVGIVMEIYYREVTLSKIERDVLNASWGKYRR